MIPEKEFSSDVPQYHLPMTTDPSFAGKRRLFFSHFCFLECPILFLNVPQRIYLGIFTNAIVLTEIYKYEPKEDETLRLSERNHGNFQPCEHTALVFIRRMRMKRRIRH